jgi:NDP-sugar pyrophosphorylase family protein
MIVNHKKNMIKAYFADENLPYNINFVEENEPLGTGGGLSLLCGKIEETIFLTNCDIQVAIYFFAHCIISRKQPIRKYRLFSEMTISFVHFV